MPQSIATSVAPPATSVIAATVSRTATAPWTADLRAAGGVSANKALRDAAYKALIALTGTNNSSDASLEAAKENSRISGGDHERAQSMAGVSRIALRSARLGDDENQTEFSQARENAPDESIKVYFPAPKFSGDNAAMVTMACFYEIKSNVKPTDPYKLDISPRSVLS